MWLAQRHYALPWCVCSHSDPFTMYPAQVPLPSNCSPHSKIHKSKTVPPPQILGDTSWSVVTVVSLLARVAVLCQLWVVVNTGSAYCSDQTRDTAPPQHHTGQPMPHFSLGAPTWAPLPPSQDPPASHALSPGTLHCPALPCTARLTDCHCTGGTWRAQLTTGGTGRRHRWCQGEGHTGPGEGRVATIN